MPREKLTLERILAEIERVVQSNQEFRLDDFVSVNIVHVEMPRRGTGKKRREINLDKYLTNKLFYYYYLLLLISFTFLTLLLFVRSF